jgi:hypothetical protein
VLVAVLGVRDEVCFAQFEAHRLTFAGLDQERDGGSTGS